MYRKYPQHRSRSPHAHACLGLMPSTCMEPACREVLTAENHCGGPVAGGGVGGSVAYPPSKH